MSLDRPDEQATRQPVPETAAQVQPTAPPQPPRTTWGARHPWLRALAWTGGSVLLLFVILFLSFWYYTTTADFQHRAADKVVGVLEDATGGRVEIGGLHFDLMHLAIEVDNLVIHGTEAADQAPYISVAKLLLRIKLNTFLAQGTAKGPRSHVGLNYLRAEQPHLHLIVTEDGKTNQPVPKKPSTSTEPVQNTLLDLQAGRVELADGLALINDRAVPIDVAANNLNANVHYIGSTDRYGATLDLYDLQTRIAAQPDVHSKLHLDAELGRDVFQLSSFQFDTGLNSHLSATALVDHFAAPEWQATVTGQLDLRQVGYLANLDGFQQGVAQLQLNGRNCEVAPQVAQQRPRLFHRREHTPPASAAKMLPPSPDCKSGYLLVGHVQVHHASYVLPQVRAVNVDAAADLRVTPAELVFSTLTGRLQGGGTIDGKLRIENWLGEVPQNAPATSATTVAAAKTANNVAKGAGAAPPVQSVTLPPVARAHAFLDVVVKGITLRTILAITGPQPYGDLGLDTSISGPVNAEWGGPAKDIASSVIVKSNLQLTPTGAPSGARQNVPVSGVVQATYAGSDETVRIQNVELHTPATTLTASGTLGVAGGDPLTSLNVNLNARDLGEFDSTLQTLGLTANGKRGTAAIPVVLHGTLAFNGTARGAIANIDVKGHLTADNIEIKDGSLDTQIDALVADAEYSPNAGIAVASSTIRRRGSVLNLAGTYAPRKVYRHHAVTYVWDDQSPLSADVKLAHGDIADLLAIAGQAGKYPVTGTADINAHVAGTARALNGQGSIVFTNGEAYGEPFERVAVNGSVQGQQITATSLLVVSNGQQITGDGGYNLATKHLTAHVRGTGIVLSRVVAFHKQVPDADGVLNIVADADGTVEVPNLHATVDLTRVVYTGKPVGEAHIVAQSAGSVVSYSLTSTLLAARVQATGKTSLLGKYDTDANVTLGNLDIANVLAFVGSDFKGSSNIAGSIHVQGPAADPMQLTGTAELTPVTATLQGFQLAAAQPLRASLHNGLLTLEQVHITGQDTDIALGGTAQLLGDSNPNGGQLHLTSTGSADVALAHSFDKDIIGKGKVSYAIGVEGRLKAPQLTGRVQFNHVDLAFYGIPNGLTDLNGTAVFNQNRLQVENITAVTGGGKLTLGGSLVYQKGIFADLTATGNNVRIRYNGLSTTANAQFKLQGSPESLLLSGNVLITRFGVGPDVDFAAFAGAGGVSLPPDPSAPTNRVRLEVSIKSAPQLDFQNSYAKLAGNVDLTIGGTLAVPSVLGKIQVTEGSATFAGNSYQLQRGTIYFTNPVRIDPVIDLTASTRVENYDVTISLSGTATSLKPTYRSEPPLTEPDIFNLLALGRTQEEAQINQQQQVQAGTDPTTSALLGGALNATVSSRVNKIFGAGSVKIDPAFVGTLGNSTARLTVQEPITKQLTLVFATNVNQSAEQLIQIQYQIDENRSLLVTRDESGVFSIVFKLRKRYR